MSTAEPSPIADTPDALTPEWLTAALRRAGVLDDAVVDAVSVTPVGTGQMCDSVRITVTYDRATDAPRSVVAKLPAADETSRATAVALRNYEKEVRFYQELAPTLSVRTPRLYHGDIDDSLGRFVLLLEDLAPATVGDQIQGCSVDDARRAVLQLARLHGARWDDPALEQIDWLVGRAAGATGTSIRDMLAAVWTGFQDRYADRLDDQMTLAGDDLFENIDGYHTPRPGPRTIVHNDYRLDNLLFHPASDEVAVVDWQTCALGVGPTDLAYFIGAGLSTEDRRAHEDELVRTYHQALGDAGVDDYSWDQCWTDYRRGSWSGVFMAVFAAMMVERTDRGDEMFLTMLERHGAQVADLEAVHLIAK
jgi:aminoglycoside/choline kinase family phosphotransferase